MQTYYIEKNLFETSIYEIHEDDKEYKIKMENKSVIKLMQKELIKLVAELREQGEQVTVYYLTGKKRKKYHVAKI